MVEGNARTTYETQGPVAQVRKKTTHGLEATRQWFGERSPLQIVLMILVPVLIVSAVAGYLFYNKRSNRTSRSRTSRKTSVRKATATRSRAQRRRRVGRRVGGRYAGRARSRLTRGRRTVATTGPATP